MQNAAHNAARNGPNNLGINPNYPAMRLPDVPNGLAIGGLHVANGVPLDLAHPKTSEDPTLWRGAQLPKQTVSTSGQTNVSITQTAQQALLTWETFNVGRNTILNFDQSAAGANASSGSRSTV
jgi:hypothetical protein